ncbi:DUF7344 domain-containing protein [Haloarcula amylovorans]|uniref:DUF7344 domain-containing protein n=1 Tax=Haloarcula amylovorans TaxID=2562280 RepID=UPI0010769599|nr:hypothetical protein [Halomicroarcula amylolytica]
MGRPSPLIRKRSFHKKGGGWTIIGIGLLSLMSILLFVSVDAEPPALLGLELILGMISPLVLIYTGYRFGKGNLPTFARWRLAVGVVVGILFATAFGLWLIQHQLMQGGQIIDSWYLTVTLGSFGAVIGLTIAVIQLEPRYRQSLFPGLVRQNEQITSPTETLEPSTVSLTEFQRQHVDTVLYEHQRLQLAILEYVYLRQGISLSVDQVADALLVDFETADEHQRQRLKTALTRTHLPYLADCNLIAYDRATRTVSAGELYT